MNYGKQWLYDDEKFFKQQLKTKKTTHLPERNAWRKPGDTRITVEVFDGQRWKLIETWFNTPEE